jgi:2-polyprenyl-3-methyl-5-hydroxy-6-metoxy-1,4-benzoquinol methylase
MDLSHCEKWVLAAILFQNDQSPRTAPLETLTDALPYWIFHDQLEPALDRLRDESLLTLAGDVLELTDRGAALGERWEHVARNPIAYLYGEFYQCAEVSTAHSQFLQRVYGLPLLQENMGSLERLLETVAPQKGERVLDLGCGFGTISEHIAASTGADVTGIDSAAVAIRNAAARNAAEGSALTFMHADMNELALPAHSFDVAISMDTLYWVDDVHATLSRVLESLRPGGRLGIFYMSSVEPDEPREGLQSANTSIGRALASLGADFRAEDYTSETHATLAKALEVALDLRPQYEAEGNEFICAYWVREAEELMPRFEQGVVARFLYYAKV